MSYSCLVGSFLNSTTATRPYSTRLVCDPTKKSVHVEIEPTRSATQKNRKSRRPNQTSRRPDQTLSATKSGRVAVVEFSLNQTHNLTSTFGVMSRDT